MELKILETPYPFSFLYSSTCSWSDYIAPAWERYNFLKGKGKSFAMPFKFKIYLDEEDPHLKEKVEKNLKYAFYPYYTLSQFTITREEWIEKKSIPDTDCYDDSTRYHQAYQGAWWGEKEVEGMAWYELRRRVQVPKVLRWKEWTDKYVQILVQDYGLEWIRKDNTEEIYREYLEAMKEKYLSEGLKFPKWAEKIANPESEVEKGLKAIEESLKEIDNNEENPFDIWNPNFNPYNVRDD